MILTKPLLYVENNYIFYQILGLGQHTLQIIVQNTRKINSMWIFNT